MKPISQDLRKLILDTVQRGDGSLRQIVRRFLVSVFFFTRLLERLAPLVPAQLPIGARVRPTPVFSSSRWKHSCCDQPIRAALTIARMPALVASGTTCEESGDSLGVLRA
jgi:hypothetical protein